MQVICLYAFKKGDKTTRQRELGDNVFTELNKFDNSIYISSVILTKFGLPKSRDVVPAPEMMETWKLHNKIYTAYDFSRQRATTIYSGAGQ
jgi:hypothetical protein